MPSFTVGNYSHEPCLCGEPETVEVNGENLRARLCGPCMMYIIARAEGHGRTNPAPARKNGKRGKRDGQTAPTAEPIPVGGENSSESKSHGENWGISDQRSHSRADSN